MMIGFSNVLIVEERAFVRFQGKRRIDYDYLLLHNHHSKYCSRHRFSKIQKNINITGLSLIPLFLIALMVFQALIFKNEKVENGFRTAYGSNLTADEENNMLSSCSTFLFATIPWMIPFIIFFASPVKALAILVYFIGLIGGLVIYRFRNKGKIANRMTAEEKERQEQKKNEELGKWK